MVEENTIYNFEESLELTNDVACLEYKRYLLSIQNYTEPFPNSDAPKNPLSVNQVYDERNSRIYTEILGEYYNREFDGTKCDFKKSYGEAGHKLHLNVGFDNVIEVARYLKQGGYHHKYLHGGEVEDGKVFTIYVGSHNLTKSIASTLSLDLTGLLCFPVDESEIEYAPNIVGRFVGGGEQFFPYGIGLRGISAHKHYLSELRSLLRSGKKAPELILAAFDYSYNALANRYGTYFYGQSNF